MLFGKKLNAWKAYQALWLRNNNMIRIIIFCDRCNPQGIRYIEQKRNIHRSDSGGRRISDGRAWFEGTFDEAMENGWTQPEDTLHICPNCQQYYT